MIEEMIFGEDSERWVRHIPIYKENEIIKPKSYGEGPFLFCFTKGLIESGNKEKKAF